MIILLQQFSPKIEEWIKVASTVGTLIAFLAALWQYRQAELWKQVSFVAEALRTMKQDLAVVNVSVMLDWNERLVRLYPERKAEVSQWILVTHETLRKALREADAVPFTDAEARIRDQFDIFFDHFERFYQFVKQGLVKVDTFKPLLQYWVGLIAEPPKALMNERRQSAIWHYLAVYGFHDAIKFLAALGVPLEQDAATSKSTTADSETGNADSERRARTRLEKPPTQ